MYNNATLARARTYKLRSNSIFGYLTNIVCTQLRVQAINSIVIPYLKILVICTSVAWLSPL